MSNSINFAGHTYTKSGNAWVRGDGSVLGATYVENAVAPAVGRYAVEVFAAGNDQKRRALALYNARRSLGAVAYNAVLKLAGELR